MKVAKVVIIHISDLHIQSLTDINEVNSKKIVDALSEVSPFNKVWLVVSGDIANAGKHEQYDVAYKLFGNIIKNIKEKFSVEKVDFFVVPGNHDVDLENDMGHKKIQDALRNGVTPSIIKNELKKQRNYLNYAKGVHCLDEKDELCFIKKFHYENQDIIVCMINTAIFSTLDEDKGLHYLPMETLNKIEKGLEGDLNIVIFHHAHHWMHETIKNRFQDILIKKADIVICGHEHDMQSQIIQKGNDSLIYLTGGELSKGERWDKSEFYIDSIDINNMEMQSIQFVWNTKRKIYQKHSLESYVIRNQKDSLEFNLDEDFHKWLYMDQANSISKTVFDYYVFPDLELVDEYSTKERVVISEKETFLNKVKESKKLFVIGGEEAGKTLLLKTLFRELNNQGFSCILCDASNLKNISIRKIMVNIFRANYNDIDGSFDLFLQKNREERVILLDNVHSIRKDQMVTLIKYFEEFFGIIVCTTQEIIEIDLAERIKQNMELEKYQRYKLLSMYKAKRLQLIKNVINLKFEIEEKESLIEKISNAITMQRKMYTMNPSFIIQFTEFYIKNFKDSFATDGNIFSKVYESNIVNRLHLVSKELTVDKIMVLLDQIAYWCFKAQKSEIEQESICEIITRYNDLHGDDVELLVFLDACIKSRVLIQTINKKMYRFPDKNLMSYFIAREIIRIWNDNLENNDLIELIKYIRYGINSTIILFITYLTDNLYLIRQIIDGTEEYTKGWEMVNLINVNIPYLASMNGQINMDPPTIEDREKNEEKEDEIDRKEIKEMEDSKIVVKDYFEEDTSDSEKLINQILRGISLLDIVSKCLPSIEHRMTREDKNRVLNIIFKLPGKIFYIWASQVENEKNDILNYLLEQYRIVYMDPKDWGNVKENDMLQYLQVESISLLLDILNLSVSNAAKPYTIKYMQGYKNKEELLYQIGMLMAYKKLDFVKDFEIWLSENEDNLKKCIPDYMKRRVIWRFLVTSRNISSEKMQRFISKYFNSRRSNTTYKNLLISREKGKKQ